MHHPFTARSKRVFSVLLACLLAGQGSAFAADADLRQLQSQILEIQNKLTRKSQLKSQTEKQLERSERQIATTGSKLYQIQQQIRQSQHEIQQLRAQRADILAQTQDHRQDLKDQVRAHYLMGRNHHLKLLLDQQDSSQLGRSLVYYSYFNDRRSQVLGSLHTEIERIKMLEDTLSRTQQTLSTSELHAKQQQDTLRQQQREQRQLVKQLDQELGRDNRRLDKLRQDEQRLSTLTNDIYESVTKTLPDIDEKKPFNKLKGKLPWPVAGKVHNNYGSQRGSGGLRWSGIVIGAAEGTPVRSVAKGRVVFSNWLVGYGFLVIVDHGGGFMSLYGHNRQLLKEVGETVAKGDILAQVGNSGGKDENALYFEIRRNGKTLNPRQWIARR